MENITELRESVAALAQLVDLQGKILSQMNENAHMMHDRIIAIEKRIADLDQRTNQAGELEGFVLSEIEQRIDALEKVKKEVGELEGFVLSEILSANK